jgi:hypothetical protein
MSTGGPSTQLVQANAKKSRLFFSKVKKKLGVKPAVLRVRDG